MIRRNEYGVHVGWNILYRPSAHIWIFTQPRGKLVREFMTSEHFKLLRTIFWNHRFLSIVMVCQLTHSGFFNKKERSSGCGNGIVGRAPRRKNADEDMFCRSSEFKAIRRGLNSFQIENIAGDQSFRTYGLFVPRRFVPRLRRFAPNKNLKSVV